MYPFPLAFSAADSHKSSTDSLASDSIAVHPYPPTPPTAPIVVPPFPPPVNAKLEMIESAPTGISKKTPKAIPTKITQFLLALHSSPHVPSPQPGEQTTLFPCSRTTNPLTLLLSRYVHWADQVVRRMWLARPRNHDNGSHNLFPRYPHRFLHFTTEHRC